MKKLKNLMASLEDIGIEVPSDETEVEVNVTVDAPEAETVEVETEVAEATEVPAEVDAPSDESEVTVDEDEEPVDEAEDVVGDTFESEEEAVEEILEASEEVEEAAEEVEEAAEATSDAIEKNEEAIEAAEEVAEESPEEAIEIIEASNESIRRILGTDAFSIVTPSLESVSSVRARRMYMETSLEAAKERSGNIFQRFWEFLKRVGERIAEFAKKLWSWIVGGNKRSEYLIGELKKLSNQRQVNQIDNKGLAQRLVLKGRVQFKISEAIKATYEDLVGAVKSARTRTEKMFKLVEGIANIREGDEVIVTEQRISYILSELGIAGYEIMQANGVSVKVSPGKNEAHWLGGYVQTWEGVEGEDNQIKYTYSFNRVNPKVEPDGKLNLPTPAEAIKLLEDAVRINKFINEDIQKTHKEYGKIGKLKGMKLSHSLVKQSGSTNFKDGMLMGLWVRQITDIHNNITVRPLNDFLKVLMATQKTMNSVALAVVKASGGEEVSAESLNLSMEELAGVVDEKDVEALRSETFVDDIETPAASGDTKDDGDDVVMDEDVDQHDMDDEETVSPKPIVSEFEDTNAAIVQEEVEEIAVAMEEFDELVEIAEEQDQLQDIVEEAQGEGGLNEIAAELMENSLESIDRRLGRFGIDVKTEMPSLESFGGIMNRRTATMMSLESIKERDRNLWETVKRILAKIWNWIKLTAAKAYDMVGGYDRRVDGLIKRLSATDLKVNEEPITNESIIDRVVDVRGKADRASIEAAIGVTVKQVKEQTTSIRTVNMTLSNIEKGASYDDVKDDLMKKALATQGSNEYGLGRYRVEVKDDKLVLARGDAPVVKSIKPLNRNDAVSVLETIKDKLMRKGEIDNERKVFKEVSDTMTKLSKKDKLTNVNDEDVAKVSKDVRELAQVVNTNMKLLLNARTSSLSGVLNFVAQTVAKPAKKKEA